MPSRFWRLLLALRAPRDGNMNSEGEDGAHWPRSEDT